MVAFSLLFLAKAALLALFVTPLWDVPDESGHYAIVQDLSDGRGLPLPGRSVLPENVLQDWMRARPIARPVGNWVAQHPPLYHLLAVPFLDAARAITPDPEWQFRAPRLLSAISGAAALLVFFRVFLAAGADPLVAFAAAAGIGVLPMYTHLSSGTNHDVFVALLGGFAALFWVRFLRDRRFADAVWMSAALGLMGVTKLSAVPVAVILLALIAPRLSGTPGRKIVLAASLGAIALAPPAAWALRHWILLGNARVHPLSRRPFDPASFLSYLRRDPVVDHTFKNFVGLIGWTGTGGGEVRWFQISGGYLAPFLLLALAVASATAWILARRAASERRWISLAVFAAVFVFGMVWLFADGDGAVLPKRLLYSLLLSVPLLAVVPAFRRGDPDAPILGSHAVFLVFGAAYLVNSWEAFDIYGQMRATNGRYFFAILPFLAMAWGLPAARRLVRMRAGGVLVLVPLAALFLDEAAFFLFRVIPFYRSGPFSR